MGRCWWSNPKPPERMAALPGRGEFVMLSPSSHGSLRPPLLPRNGQLIEVLGIARISTEHQDQRSLADQEALSRRWLDDHVGLPYHLGMIVGRGSGECLDRDEARRARTAVESGRMDLVI